MSNLRIARRFVAVGYSRRGLRRGFITIIPRMAADDHYPDTPNHDPVNDVKSPDLPAMPDKFAQTKKRKSKWMTPYSKMSFLEAEDRLGIALALRGTPVKTMLEGKSINAGKEGILQVKEKVYDGLVGQLEIEGYPTEADPDFKEANITDLVIFIMHPILRYFRQQTGRDVRLRREKEIVAVDFATGGMEEFVVMDFVSLREKNLVLVVEAKKVSLGEARKQCFLSLKDMRDNNGGGSVYGFITTGDSWRMVSYDGTFQMSEKMEILFDTMDDDKERWMKDYSILVDCMYAALSEGAPYVVIISNVCQDNAK